MTLNTEERIRFTFFISSLVWLKTGPFANATTEFRDKIISAMNVNLAQDEQTIALAITSLCGMYDTPSEEIQSMCKRFSSSDKTELKQIVKKCLVASGVPYEVQIEIMSIVNNLLD